MLDFYRRLLIKVAFLPLMVKGYILNLFNWYNNPEPVITREGRSLTDHFGEITVYLREDGEFAIGLDFHRTDKTCSNMAALMLQLINTGYLTEYFIDALTAWEGQDPKRRDFSVDVMKEWSAILADEAKDAGNKIPKKDRVVVAPDNVFGLKNL